MISDFGAVILVRLLYVVKSNDLFLVRNCPDGISISLPTPCMDVTEDYVFSPPASGIRWLLDHCSLPVYRQYVFTFGSFCVVLFAPCGTCSLPLGLAWVSFSDLLHSGIEHDVLDVLQLTCGRGSDITVPWLGPNGFSVYIRWAEAVLYDCGITLTSSFHQIKNAFMSSVFSAGSNSGVVYLKIVSNVYVARTGTERLLSELHGGYPHYLGVTPDGAASLMLEMPGHDVEELDIGQFCHLLNRWSEMQINSAGDNPHRLPDSSLRRLAAGLDNLPFDVEKIFSLVGRAFSPDDRRRFQMKLSGVSAALARLSAVGIPDSLCHGDIRPGNIRMIGNVPVLYDWGMAFYGFPFYDALHFLRVLHRSLTPQQTEQLKLAYLSPWQRRFPLGRLQEAWELGQQSMGYFMLQADCGWVLGILEACGGVPADGTMDGHAFSCRLRSFEKVFYRFLSA